MGKSLLETYSKRLSIAESVYEQAHEGKKLDTNRKLAVAMCLNNVNKYINEAFTNSVGTQRADLGAWKKFTLNLVNVAVPNLIANDLVIVHPMASFSGYITYVKYTYGSNKGATTEGTVINDSFRLGTVDSNFTADIVTNESFTSATGTATAYEPAWGPVVSDVFTNDGTTYDFKYFVGDTFSAWSYGNFDSDGKVPASVQTAGSKFTFCYKYNNELVPQNDIPTINAEIANIPLIAKDRKVNIYYSQIASFQAKTDYGFDLGDQLAEKAVAELNYEIDTEIVEKICEVAGDVQDDLTWSKTQPYGVSKKDHYEGFSEILEVGKVKVYDRTHRFLPNYCLIASSLLPVLSQITNFKSANPEDANGPFFAGTLNGLKFYVSPSLTNGEYVLGVNGKDYMSSVLVYAPYMPVVPTQLLGYADGGMNQGWSTVYALETLNADLCIKGQVTA